MNKQGYIYVLTNESFHRENWIKIGYAEDVTFCRPIVGGIIVTNLCCI